MPAAVGPCSCLASHMPCVRALLAAAAHAHCPIPDRSAAGEREQAVRHAVTSLLSSLSAAQGGLVRLQLGLSASRLGTPTVSRAGPLGFTEVWEEGPAFRDLAARQAALAAARADVDAARKVRCCCCICQSAACRTSAVCVHAHQCKCMPPPRHRRRSSGACHHRPRPAAAASAARPHLRAGTAAALASSTSAQQSM